MVGLGGCWHPALSCRLGITHDGPRFICTMELDASSEVSLYDEDAVDESTTQDELGKGAAAEEQVYACNRCALSLLLLLWLES